MKHVIIEGPDGAGKTYLAHQLCDEFDMHYHHEGPPPVIGSPAVLYHYAKLLTNVPSSTVFDRFYIGELVYGPLLRGGSSITDDDLRIMDHLIRSTGTIIVFCLPGWLTCCQNTRVKQELIDDETVLFTAYQRWEELSQRGFSNSHIYNFLQHNVNQLKKVLNAS